MKKAFSSPLIRLLSHNKTHRPRIILAAICSILNKLFDVMPEILIGMAIDVVVNKEKSFLAGFGVLEPLHQVLTLGGLTLFIWGFESLFEFFHLVLWRNLAQTIQHEMRIDAYEHVQNLDISYFEDKSTGNLVSILNDDVNQLERFLNGGANALIQVFTTVVAVGGVFFFISPTLAGVSFVPIPLIIFGAFFFQKRAQPLYKEVREKVGLLSARLANNISGIATIKSFTAEDRELKRFAQESLSYLQSNRKAINVSSAFIPVIRMAILMGFLGTFLLGGWMVIEGKLAVGSYGVLVFLTQRLLWPLTELAETVDLYERAMASTRRILDLIKTPLKIKSTGLRTREKPQGAVTFEDVSFSYPKRPNILKDINLTIKKGDTVAFVGQTGSGKSTLIKLLLRFYKHEKGKILLDQFAIQDYSLQNLRESIGLVSQDVFLFHGSVRDNIAFGNPAASQEEIINAAKTAEADQFITELPEGYETLVGERGQKLSGGQKQRISIARAILKDPPIMILDEATSAVDNETEAAIQRSLRKIEIGRTTIIIAHRLSTIVHADQIYVLDKGKIVDHGTSEELLKRDGIYAKLWHVQIGEPT